MRLLLGGSPCTKWSIAQTKDRETEPSGIGWELFKNYRIARDKYKPDYFLYENNESMAPAIREQITKELGVPPVPINSARVSAQNRNRLYWAGKRMPDGAYAPLDIQQPEDCGIILRDILESGQPLREKGYALLSTTGGTTAEDVIRRRQRNGVAEPIRIGTIENNAKNAEYDSQQYRVYSPDGKSVTLCGQGGGLGAKTGLYATPLDYTPLRSCNVVVTDQNIRCSYKDGTGTAQGYTVYFDDVKAPAVIAGHAHKMKVIERATGKEYPVYKVQNGLITIKGQQYPIKLADGYYIIRKLTVTECKRLQTVPESYIFPVSNSQAYKMLGNGWTVKVIAHILGHIPGITLEPLEVLSMYDGMSCGHLALDILGADVREYYATEIDKYAIKTTQHNYPDTVQLGDAFQVREDGWRVPERSESE